MVGTFKIQILFKIILLAVLTNKDKWKMTKYICLRFSFIFSQQVCILKLNKKKLPVD